jgi:hypothetical protein
MTRVGPWWARVLACVAIAAAMHLTWTTILEWSVR